ncbi:MAG: thioesterase family protein, partial [Legionellaceae bacterium]|nr:thioesterase family protein [Legionellaceae bacterium]
LLQPRSPSVMYCMYTSSALSLAPSRKFNCCEYIIPDSAIIVYMRHPLMKTELFKKPHFIWHSEVRGYEIDLQGIVNNAVYLQYFDHARVLHFLSKGINWQEWHKKGYNLVVSHIDLHFKYSLREQDKFYVTSTMQQEGRLKIVFYQSIFNSDNKLIAQATNTVVCVAIESGKPVMPLELLTYL